ncbi:cadherin repeat domain-containing protein [Candidatus Woesearchaeota archaeon]|nr:cadherin repeat domain-containing protein [Candidatus Woesearchaeota archaeon]
MKHSKLEFLFITIFLLLTKIVNADINVNIVAPTSGWYNTYGIILSATTNDYADVTFSTDSYAIITTLYNNNIQGSLILNSTYLNEGSNIIYVYAENASNPIDLDIAGVADINIDVSAPTWDSNPINHTIEYGSAFSYDVNASDLQSVTYSVNDTANFAVDANGLITNTAVIALGTHHLQINATDPFNHTNSTTITITVQDTTPPVWVQTPANQTLAYRENLNYNIAASDLAGISIYFINDTSNFTIDSTTGVLTNPNFLSPGIYSLNISVNDTSNNILSQIITITVNTCVESWSCSSWTNCLAGTQTRTCTDLNECGTESNKPSEIQSCSSGGGGGGNGKDCIPEWECGKWGECINQTQTRICTDLNNCNNNTEMPPTEKKCKCKEDWLCDPWSECNESGQQERTCIDLNNCGTTDKIPKLIKKCKYKDKSKKGASKTEGGLLGVTGSFIEINKLIKEKRPITIAAVFFMILLGTMILKKYNIFNNKPKKKKRQI